jgi:hypothetical protein
MVTARQYADVSRKLPASWSHAAAACTIEPEAGPELISGGTRPTHISDPLPRGGGADPVARSTPALVLRICGQRRCCGS